MKSHNPTSYSSLFEANKVTHFNHFLKAAKQLTIPDKALCNSAQKLIVLLNSLLNDVARCRKEGGNNE